MSTQELDDYLASIGSSPASLKRQIQGELAWDRLLRRNVQPFVNVSEDEVNELFDRLQASRGTTEYRLGEIYLSANSANREQVLANAKQIVDQLARRQLRRLCAAVFEASTAVVGGDLGWIRLEQLHSPRSKPPRSRCSPASWSARSKFPAAIRSCYLIDKRQVGMADPRDALLSLKQISHRLPRRALPRPKREQRGCRLHPRPSSTMPGCGDADAARSGHRRADRRQRPDHRSRSCPKHCSSIAAAT